jgi:hypothetical protein
MQFEQLHITIVDGGSRLIDHSGASTILSQQTDVYYAIFTPVSPPLFYFLEIVGIVACISIIAYTAYKIIRIIPNF